MCAGPGARLTDGGRPWKRVNELELDPRESLSVCALGQYGWRSHLVSASSLCDIGQVTESL